MIKAVIKICSKFLFGILVTASISSYALEEFTDKHKLLAKELSNTKIPRPTVKSFELSRKLSIDIHYKIFKVVKNICYEEKIPDKNCRWGISVERTPEFNAYATKSSRVIISTGLIDGITYEDELAFVIAHEIAHHILDHIGKNQGNLITGSILGSLILDDYLAGLMLGKIANTAISSVYESKADAVAVKIIKEAGYDLDKARLILLRMTKKGYRITTKLFDSHPAGFDRIIAYDEIAKRL